MVAIALIALAGTSVGTLIVGAALAYRWPEPVMAFGRALVVGVAALFAHALATT